MKRLLFLFALMLCSLAAYNQNVLYYCGFPGPYCPLISTLIEEQATECSEGNAEVTEIFAMPTVADVEDMDVMIFVLPAANFSAAVAAEVENRLSEGAVLFVVGENGGCCVPQNNRIDDLLGQIGSTMTNQNSNCFTICGVGDPLNIESTGSCATEGMSSFQGNLVSHINPGGGLTLMNSCGAPTLVEEAVNGGLIYYISDINWIDPCMTESDILMSNIICNCSNPCDVGVSTPIDSIFFCEGDPPFLLDVDTFSNDNPATITWTATNGGEAYLDDLTIEDPLVTLPPLFEGIITYYIQIEGDTGDCFDYDSIVVVANLNPVPIIEEPDSICTNEPGYFLVGTPPDGDWGGAADIDGFIDPMVLGGGTHLVTYSFTSENMCTGETTIQIVIYDTAIIMIEPLDDPMCLSAGDIELIATPEGGMWSDPVVGSIFNPEDAGLGLTELTYTYTTENGCMTSLSIEFLIIPEFISEIIGPDELCTTDIPIQYEGILADGEWGGVVDFSGFIDPFTLGEGVHEITYMSPPLNCNTPASFFVEIFEPPSATVTENTSICNGGPDTEINFSDLVTDGDISGTWEDIEDSGAMGMFPFLDFEGVESGVYVFEYTTNSAEGTCEEQTYEVFVIVEECTCPSLALENPEDLCQLEVLYDLQDIKITDEDGTFTIIGDPGGMNPAELINGIMQGTDADAGIYVIQFTLANPVDGCPDSVVFEILITETAIAEVVDTIVCNVEGSGDFVSVLDLTGLVISGDMTGTWVDVDGSGAMGPDEALDFEGVTPGVYTFEYTTGAAVAPCENAIYSIEITVLDCNCPELSVMNTGPYCSDMVVLDLATILTSDSTGTWAIIDDPGGMNPAEIIGEELIGMGVDAGTYVLEFTLDEAPPTGCTESITVTIEVNAAVEIELQDSLQVCNSLDGGMFDAIVDLGESILIGGTNGTWVDLDGSGASGPDDALDFTGVLPGAYTFEYTSDEAVAPCEEQTVEMIIIVNDCDCPVIELSGAQIFCNDDLSIDAELFNISGQLGSWAIVDDPGGANPAELIGTDFEGTGSDAGIYVLEFTLDEDPPIGCDNSSQVIIEIVASLSADVEDYTQICNTDISGGQTAIDFTDMVTGVLTGMWVDVDNSGATGVLPNLDFTDVPPGIYSFSYTLEVDFPCSDSVYVLEVEVIECLCPPIGLGEPDDMCDTGGELNLDDLLINAAAGEWTIVDDPGGANPAEIVGNVIQSGGADAGDYVLQYTLMPPPPEGCPDSGVVTLTIVAGPVAGAADGAFAVCEGESGNTSLFDLITGNDAGGEWTQVAGEDVGNALNGGSGILNYTGLVNGTYQFMYTVEGVGPCGDAAAEVMIEIYANPIADAGADMNLDCSTPQVELGGGSSQGTFAYNWEGPSGTLGTTITQMANEAGIYTITVTNTQTGCESEDEVVVGTQGEIITNAIVETEGIGCEGGADGVIRILEVEGGTGPYMFSVNGGNFSDQNQWGGLEAGEYNILVEDIFGCQFLVLAEIEDREVLELSIGGIELELEYGEEMNLEALLNINEDEIAEIIWSSGGVELCNGCLSLTIVGTESGVITVKVTDMFGCKAEASFAYSVVINENVYVPTIFSPNGDGLNDEFYVYGGESAVQVVYMRIYSRWGELVYEARNMPLTDPEFGWDGTFKGEVMNPNVFSYELEVLFDRGVIKLYFGDITLVR